MHASRTAKANSDEQHVAKVDAGREAWTLLLNLLRADQTNLNKVWAEFGLSSAQGDLLCLLEPGKPVPMVSLARKLHCDDSNVTGLVDRLEQRGMIERQSNPNDRRVKLIALTKSGATTRTRLMDRLFEPLPFIAVLTPKDKIALKNILLKANRAMQINATVDK
jgi:DNA-binding MarR family transcriptional regulator